VTAAQTPQLTAEAELVKAIREVGREPAQRDTFYQPIKVWGNAAPAAAEPPAKKSLVLEENLATG